MMNTRGNSGGTLSHSRKVTPKDNLEDYHENQNIRDCNRWIRV